MSDEVKINNGILSNYFCGECGKEYDYILDECDVCPNLICASCEFIHYKEHVQDKIANYVWEED